ncbi:hypothetical protein PbDSM24746_42530 [Paenibacillus macerans]|nr:hypothetical protein PbDSM24746_42530 [Paenibacillus macerans]GBK70584.1 hypothetical protein PbJCM17693_42920 [Paenibacillus macerans]
MGAKNVFSNGEKSPFYNFTNVPATFEQLYCLPRPIFSFPKHSQNLDGINK